MDRGISGVEGGGIEGKDTEEGMVCSVLELGRFVCRYELREECIRSD